MLRAHGCTATPVPFILDEIDLLKHMPILAVLRDMGRKSRVALFPMWQSVGQIEETWGKSGKRSWYASAAWRLYAMLNDEETAAEVSRRCGTYTVLARSEGNSTNRPGGPAASFGTRRQNDNVSEQPRQLLSEYEAQTALRPDEAIVIVRGQPVLRCRRPLYWRRPEMAAVIAPDTYRAAAKSVVANDAPLPASCARCASFQPPVSRCRRHAPGIGFEELELTYWPLVKATDRCGDGQVVDDGTETVLRSLPPLVPAWRPPISPKYRQGKSVEWWEQSGYCTRFAPGPSNDHSRQAYWRVTHSADRCGDGEEAEVGEPVTLDLPLNSPSA